MTEFPQIKVRSIKRKNVSMVAEFIKVVLGGAAGVATGYFIVLYVLGVDLLKAF